jgi:hypothetical protein
VVRMKNLKSLQVVALAGVAVALTAGCSSTSTGRADNDSSGSHAAYRWVSSGGWVPITDAQKMTAFPVGWVPGQFGPVSYETYYMAPPAGSDAGVTVATTDSDLNQGSAATTTTTTVTSDGDTTVSSTTYHEGLQPGDTFVEAAGADSDSAGTVHRVILYTPFNSTGVGR